MDNTIIEYIVVERMISLSIIGYTSVPVTNQSVDILHALS